MTTITDALYNGTAHLLSPIWYSRAPAVDPASVAEASGEASGDCATFSASEYGPLFAEVERLSETYPNGQKALNGPLAEVINFLQLEGNLPYHLTLLLKAAGGYLHMPEGLVLFKRLCGLATDSHELNRLIQRHDFHNFFAHIAIGAKTIHSDAQAKYAAYQEHAALSFLGASVGRIAGHDREKAAALASLEAKNAVAFKTALSAIFQVMKQEHAETNPLKATHFQELKELVDGKKSLSWKEVYFLFKAEEFYDKYTSRVDQSLRTLSGVQYDEAAALRIHQQAKLALKDRANLPLPSLIEWGQVGGRITRSFIALDNSLDRVSHVWCGCQVKAPEGQNKHRHHPLPEVPVVRSRTENVLLDAPDDIRADRAYPGAGAVHPFAGRSFDVCTFGLGGAHRVIQTNLSRRLAEEGAHVFFSDGAEEVLLHGDDPIYPIGKMLGKDWTLISFLQYFLKNEWWGFLDMMNKLFGAEPADAVAKKARRFTAYLLEHGVDAPGIKCFQRCIEPYAQACAQVGQGMYGSACDWDAGITGHLAIEAVPHAYMGLYDSARGTKAYMEGDIAPEQLLDGGLPVAPEFLKRFSSKDIAALKEKYGVESDAQVVVIMGGGEGQRSDYLEWIAESYAARGAELPKVHVFMINGKNAAEKARHEAEMRRLGIDSLGEAKIDDALDVTNFKSGNFSFSNSGWTGSSFIAEMMAMTRAQTDHGEGLLVSHKAGGGTFAELAATGTRALVRDVSNVKHTPGWETENLKQWRERGLCESFPAYANRVPYTGYHSKKAEFTDALFRMLATEGPSKRPFDTVDSKAFFLQSVQHVFQSAQRDAAYQARTEVAYDMGTFPKA